MFPEEVEGQTQNQNQNPCQSEVNPLEHLSLLSQLNVLLFYISVLVECLRSMKRLHAGGDSGWRISKAQLGQLWPSDWLFACSMINQFPVFVSLPDASMPSWPTHRSSSQVEAEEAAPAASPTVRNACAVPPRICSSCSSVCSARDSTTSAASCPLTSLRWVVQVTRAEL